LQVKPILSIFHKWKVKNTEILKQSKMEDLYKIALTSFFFHFWLKIQLYLNNFQTRQGFEKIF
jgi:hypothetical protein